MSENAILLVRQYEKDLETIYEIVYKAFPKQIRYQYQNPTRTVRKFIENATKTILHDEKRGDITVYQKGEQNGI